MISLHQAQATNLRLTRTLHTGRDWQGRDTHFARKVCYWGRVLGLAEQREVFRPLFWVQYQQLLQTSPSGQLALRQLYSAGAYCVVMKGLMTSSDTP